MRQFKRSDAFRRYQNGRYIHGNFGSRDNKTMSDNTLFLVPIMIDTVVQIDRLGIEVNVVGSAGSVIRLGVFKFVHPDTFELIVDAGTVDSAGSTGWKPLTIDETLHPGLHAFGSVSQGAPDTPPTVVMTTPSVNPLFDLPDPPNLAIGSSYSQSAVTGALSDVAPSGYSNRNPIVAARVAAG